MNKGNSTPSPLTQAKGENNDILSSPFVLCRQRHYLLMRCVANRVMHSSRELSLGEDVVAPAVREVVCQVEMKKKLVKR